MFNKPAANRKKGFTLIEVVVAAFIVVVGITGLAGLINRIFSYAGTANSQLSAAYLAKEGIEIVKNIRDSNYLAGGKDNWTTGLFPACETASGGCEVDYTTSNANIKHYSSADFLKTNGDFLGYSGGVATSYQRKITIDRYQDEYGSDYLNVKSVILWNDQGKNHSFILQENIYNWWPW